MATRPQGPRIPPLTPQEMPASTAEFLDSLPLPDGVPLLFSTVARAEGLTRRWIPFGAKLLNGKLPVRDRELLVLRTGWNCQAEYEWSQHVEISLAAGLMPEEIQRVTEGPDADWGDIDAALLRAADELHEDSCINDGTWAVLSGHYSEAQLIELIMLVGQYHLVAMTVNTLGVPFDTAPRFPRH